MRTKENGWTTDEIRRLWLLYRAGKSYEEIASSLGRTEKSIKSKIAFKRREEPATWKIISKRGKCTQPCPDCLYGSGYTNPVTNFKCPWADRLEIVPGWDAEVVPYPVHNTNQPVRVEITYDIKSCPHFDGG